MANPELTQGGGVGDFLEIFSQGRSNHLFLPIFFSKNSLFFHENYLFFASEGVVWPLAPPLKSASDGHIKYTNIFEHLFY